MAKLVSRIDSWWDEYVEGCPRHMHYPAMYLFWEWVLHPGADMGFRRWLTWYRRKD